MDQGGSSPSGSPETFAASSTISWPSTLRPTATTGTTFTDGLVEHRTPVTLEELHALAQK